MGRVFLAAACLAALVACHTGSGGSTSFNPFNPTPGVTQTITAGISAGAFLSQAVLGPDDRVWFSESGTSKLGAVTTAGVLTEYPMVPDSRPNAIVVGPDGNIWTGGAGQILRVTTSGKFTSYPIAGAHIGGMIVGPDNDLWFTDDGNDRVGFITTQGIVTSYAAPAGTSPTQIATGGDGNLWVTDSNGSILRVSTAGGFTQYTTGITAGAHPQAIVSASDGYLYFTEPFFSSNKNDRIGRITISGAISEIGSLAPNADPNQIAIGKNANLYFTELGTGNLGKVAIPQASISETALGLMQAGGIANGVDDNLWVGGRQTIYKIKYLGL